VIAVAILVGLQGSGKSTFARAELSMHAHVSKDSFPSARNKTKRQARELEEALARGVNVVVDNTNPTREERAGIIALARAAGAQIDGYYFESRLEVCKARNEQREGRARVPDVALYATAKKLERPAHAEGFDTLHYVRPREGGGFDILAWKDDDETG